MNVNGQPDQEQEIVTMADEPTPQIEEQESRLPVEPKRGRSSHIIYYSIAFTIALAVVVGYLIVNISTTRLNPNCGTGLSCMNQSEVISLFGPSGTYRSYITTDPKTIYNLTNDSSITEAWVVVYGNTTPKSTLLEGVFRIQNPKVKYDQILYSEASHITYNVTNATVNGMTYSAFSYPSNGTFLSLVGYKNNELTQIIYVGSHAPSIADLASAISVDMP